MKPVTIHAINGDLHIEDMSSDHLARIYQYANLFGDAEAAEKLNALYELSVLESDLELTAGEESVPQLGGFHGDVKGQIPGFESHHIPAQSVQSEKADKLPSIALSKEDHAMTDSYRGRSNSKYQSFLPDVPREDAYKVDAAEMIEDGRYVDLVRDELYNVRDACGNKYDGAIQQYLDAAADYISREGVPQARDFAPKEESKEEHFTAPGPEDKETINTLDLSAAKEENPITEASEDASGEEGKVSFLGRLFHRDDDTETTEAKESYSSIGKFEGHDVGIAGNVIGDPEAGKAYEEYYSHQDEYHTNSYDKEDTYMAFVDPNHIEGVHMRGLASERTSDAFSVESPESFWGMHGDETHDRYVELTSHIPEINDRLAGKSAEEQEQIIKDLRNDETLGSCASLCYSPDNRVKVWDMGNGIYDFGGDGRHRILAARENLEAARQEALNNGEPFDESRYALPVEVVGSIERNNTETQDESSSGGTKSDLLKESGISESADISEGRGESPKTTSWEADREEILGNYRENLMDLGVSKERIDPFIESERTKMDRGHNDFINGAAEPYIYHDPLNWQEVADTLNAGKEWDPEISEEAGENTGSGEDKETEPEEKNDFEEEKGAEAEEADLDLSPASSRKEESTEAEEANLDLSPAPSGKEESTEAEEANLDLSPASSGKEESAEAEEADLDLSPASSGKEESAEAEEANLDLSPAPSGKEESAEAEEADLDLSPASSGKEENAEAEEANLDLSPAPSGKEESAEAEEADLNMKPASSEEQESPEQEESAGEEQGMSL